MLTWSIQSALTMTKRIQKATGNVKVIQLELIQHFFRLKTKEFTKCVRYLLFVGPL